MEPNNPVPVSSPVPAFPEGRKLPPVGGLFSRAWQLYKSKVKVLLGIYVVALVVTVASTLVFGGGGALLSGGNMGALSSFVGLTVFIAIFINVLAAASALYAVIASTQVGIVEAYKEGLKRFLPYLWISILVAIATVGGLILLVIPGIIFAVWFTFAPYVFLQEGITGVSALKKSKALVEGYWWAVLGRVALLILCAMAIGIGVGIIAALFKGVPVVEQLINGIYTLLFTPFCLIYMYLVYQDLRGVKNS